MSYSNENRGALFKNTVKHGAKSADFRGSITASRGLGVLGLGVLGLGALRPGRQRQIFQPALAGSEPTGEPKLVAAACFCLTAGAPFNDEIPWVPEWRG